MKPKRTLFYPATEAPPGGGGSSPQVEPKTEVKAYDPGDPGGLAKSILDDEPPPSPAEPKPAPKKDSPKPKQKDQEPIPQEDVSDDFDFSPIDLSKSKSDEGEIVEHEEEDVHDDTPPQNQDEQPQRGQGKALREALKVSNSELKEARERLESMRQEHESKTRELQEQIRSLQNSSVTRNPTSHPEIQEIVRPYDQKVAGFLRESSIEGHDAQTIKASIHSNIAELSKIPGGSGSQEYIAAIRKTRQEISDDFPNDVASRIMSLVDDGVRTAEMVKSKINTIAQDSNAHEYREAAKQYEAHAKEWNEISRGWLNPAQGAIDHDPYNPTVFLHKAISEDPDLGKQIEATKKKVMSTMMALPPVDPTHLEGKTAEQIADFFELRESNHQKGVRALHSKIGDFVVWYQIGPSILKELDELKSNLASVRDATPVPGSDGLPTTHHGKKDDGLGSAQDVKSYDPGTPNIDLG